MRGKIKVLHVIGTFQDGGTESLMIDILSRLDKERFELTACSPEVNCKPAVVEKFQAKGIRTHLFKENSGPGLILSMRRYISKDCFDIIHTHHYTWNTLGRIAAILAGAPNILTYNHNWPGTEKTRHRVLFRFLNSWTKKNIVVSETVRRYFTDVVGISPDKVVKISNGIDLDVFSPPAEETKTEIKKELNIPLNAFIVGFAGRLIGWKRPDLFIKTASLLAKLDPDMYFIVAGDGEKKKELKKMAEELGLNSKITFLGWRPDMHRIYQAMDVFTVLSESGGNRFNDEGFSLVSAEAMATGLPLAGVDNDINREVMGIDAAIFGKAEPGNIAYNIRLLSENEPLRKKLGLAGRKKAERDYDIGNKAKLLSEIYECVVQVNRCVR